MGDKSPKAKLRTKSHKDAAKAQAKNVKVRRQASYDSGQGATDKK